MQRSPAPRPRLVLTAVLLSVPLLVAANGCGPGQVLIGSGAGGSSDEGVGGGPAVSSSGFGLGGASAVSSSGFGPGGGPAVSSSGFGIASSAASTTSSGGPCTTTCNDTITNGGVLCAGSAQLSEQASSQLHFCACGGIDAGLQCYEPCVSFCAQDPITSAVDAKCMSCLMGACPMQLTACLDH